MSKIVKSFEVMVESPLYVQISKSTKFSLNINAYRNAHYMVLTKAKHAYEEIMLSKLGSIPIMDRVDLEYVLHAPRSNSDLSNFCCIVDKFFTDTLTLANKIKDDNIHYVRNVKYSFGSVCPKNPHCNINIKGYIYENPN